MDNRYKTMRLNNKIGQILGSQQWSFCKEVPESKIQINGTATLSPVAGKPHHGKWRERGSWVDKRNKRYACTLEQEYCFTAERLIIYSGIDNKTLLHDFMFPPFKAFPFSMRHAHFCGQDCYVCEWVFLNEKAFNIQYTVLGPQKNYRIAASYTGLPFI